MPPTAYDLWRYSELMEPGKELEVLAARHLNAFPCNPGRALRG
jgi:hypothetical protein